MLRKLKRIPKKLKDVYMSVSENITSGRWKPLHLAMISTAVWLTTAILFLIAHLQDRSWDIPLMGLLVSLIALVVHLQVALVAIVHRVVDTTPVQAAQDRAADVTE